MSTYGFDVEKSFDDEYSVYKVLEDLSLTERTISIVLPKSPIIFWQNIALMCERLGLSYTRQQYNHNCHFLFKFNSKSQKLECVKNDSLGS